MKLNYSLFIIMLDNYTASLQLECLRWRCRSCSCWCCGSHS